jgi:pyruvyltransferase
MRQFLPKVKENLKLLFRPVIVNAFIFNENNTIQHKNWGDDINYFFLSEIIQRPILIYNNVSFAFR